MISRIPRCGCKQSKKNDKLFCSSKNCECAKSSGCNILCPCLNAEDKCYHHISLLEKSMDDCSLDEGKPSNQKRRKPSISPVNVEAEASESSVSSVDQLIRSEASSVSSSCPIEVGHEGSESEESLFDYQPTFSSNRFTRQQRLRMVLSFPPCIEKTGEAGDHRYELDYLGFSASSDCFVLQRI